VANLLEPDKLAQENSDPFNHPRPFYGKVYDTQVITFLLDLIQKKNHLKYLLHFYSNAG
jgi:hypothetical protein